MSKPERIGIHAYNCFEYRSVPNDGQKHCSCGLEQLRADAGRFRKLVAMETPDTNWILGDLGLIRGTRGIGIGRTTVREAVDTAV